MTGGEAASRAPDPRLAHDAIADSFDEVMNEYDFRRRVEVLIDDFLGDVDLEGRRVLDAGCGTGRATELLRARGARVVALDLGRRLVRRASDRTGCPGVVGDAEHPPLAPGSFDVVFSTEMIEHTPSPERTLRALYSLVRPGGLLSLSTPNRRWLWAVELANALDARPYKGLENFLTPGRLAAVLREEGADIRRHVGIHLLPFQVPGITPLLRRVDRLGDRLLPVMINQCVLAARP